MSYFSIIHISFMGQFIPFSIHSVNCIYPDAIICVKTQSSLFMLVLGCYTVSLVGNFSLNFFIRFEYSVNTWPLNSGHDDPALSLSLYLSLPLSFTLSVPSPSLTLFLYHLHSLCLALSVTLSPSLVLSLPLSFALSLPVSHSPLHLSLSLVLSGSFSFTLPRPLSLSLILIVKCLIFMGDYNYHDSLYPVNFNFNEIDELMSAFQVLILTISMYIGYVCIYSLVESSKCLLVYIRWKIYVRGCMHVCVCVCVSM